MALTRGETGITWSTASSVTLSAATQTDSDAVVFNAADVQAAIQVDADNAGTPASGDYLDVWIKYTSGDVLGDSSDDYDTDEHALYLGRLDTYATNTPGEDPARATWEIPCSAKGFKLSVAVPAAATHDVVVKARLAYQRG